MRLEEGESFGSLPPTVECQPIAVSLTFFSKEIGKLSKAWEAGLRIGMGAVRISF